MNADIRPSPRRRVRRGTRYQTGPTFAPIPRAELKQISINAPASGLFWKVRFLREIAVMLPHPVRREDIAQ
jgi:hypothetical protein